MNNRSMQHSLVLILLAICLLQGAAPAAAQIPERQVAFVYGINAASGTNYVGSFAPPTTRTIYLLANNTSIISPRMTEIYYWPITNEYRASWELLNEPVEGTLEVLRGGQIIERATVISNTIQFRPQGTEANATIYLGEQATAAHEAFVERQRAFRDASAQHLEDQQAWFALADEIRRRIEAGEEVSETLPPQPQAPAPIGIFSNGLNSGIPLTLPEGAYRIQLRQPDGTILAGSERDLVVFAARRSAIGYTVLPETRWTTPEQVDDLNDVIVGRANSRIYLVPRLTREYPARPYAMMQNPQRDMPENAEWTWIAGEAITSGVLELRADDQVLARRELTPYRVVQVPGGQLGYEVQPFSEADQQRGIAPDFTAYPLDLSPANGTTTIQIVGNDGQQFTASRRLVRVPITPALGLLLGLSAVPLVAGGVVIIRRRRRMRLPRNSAG